MAPVVAPRSDLAHGQAMTAITLARDFPRPRPALPGRAASALTLRYAP